MDRGPSLHAAGRRTGYTYRCVARSQRPYRGLLRPYSEVNIPYSIRSRMSLTAPAREGRKEGAKNIKTYWHISRFTYGKLL